MFNSASGYTDQVPGETAWTHLHSAFFQLFLPVWASQPFRLPTVPCSAANWTCNIIVCLSNDGLGPARRETASYPSDPLYAPQPMSLPRSPVPR
jgi:hypothetical protein